MLESLIQAGAFDALQLRRSRLMAGLDQALEKAQNLKRLQDTKQMSMFAGLAVSHNDDEWLPEAEPWEKSVKLAREKEALGVYLSGHPLDAYRSQLKVRAKVTTADLAEIPDSQEVNLGVVVTSLKEKVGKKGGHLAILTVEDLAGSVEVLVFSRFMSGRPHRLKQPSLPLWLKGAVLPGRTGDQTAGPGNRSPGGRPDPLAGKAGPPGPGRQRHPRAAAQTQGSSGPPSRTGSGLPALPGRHREEAVLALPPDLGLSPTAELAEEVNRLLGYPALEPTRTKSISKLRPLRKSNLVIHEILRSLRSLRMTRGGLHRTLSWRFAPEQPAGRGPKSLLAPPEREGGGEFF